MRLLKGSRKDLPLYLMLLPPVLVLLIYNYFPMFGLVMAFQRFEPVKGFFYSSWVGLANFKRLLIIPDTLQVIFNTFYIASMKIIVELLVAIVTALLLNELSHGTFRRVIQTVIYFPYFISWVILGGIFRDVLSLDGIVNGTLASLGLAPVQFLSNAPLFPWVLVITETWQTTGFSAIIFLAAISSISPSLYEAASMDGAGRLTKAWHITLPGISSTIILLTTLSMGYILNAGFEQVLNLYSPLVYSSGDVIDTWVYRMGLQQAQYSLAASVGLFRSVVSLIVISLSYYLSARFANYRIF